MLQLSSRLANVPASAVRKLVPLALEAKARGTTVYHLNIGDPDIPTPNVMIDAIKRFEINPVRYAHSQGEKALVDALITYYHQAGYSYIESPHIQVTQGGSEALAMALFATCEIGDEVLVPEPFFTGYASLAPIAGVTLKPIPLSIADGFHLPPKETITALLTPKTKAILYCSPNNPTGTVFSREEVRTLIDIAQEHHLFIMADEVYREFVFDGREQVSLFDYMQEIPDQAIVLDSLSKRYSVPGFRLGMLVSLHQTLMEGVLRMGMGRLSASLVDQVAAAELKNVTLGDILAVRDEYQKRRNVVYEELAHTPGVTIQLPEGAFYAVVGLPVEAESFCAWLLSDFNMDNETVMLAPMPGFYATPGKGRNEVRIAYVLEEGKLRRAMQILKHAINHYS